MKSARLRIGFVLCVLLLIVAAFIGLRSNDERSAKPHSPELEYLKAVNSVAPPRDPELMFILMGDFASLNLQDEGAEFFSARLKEFEPQLTSIQKSLYLGIIGLLRAQHEYYFVVSKDRHQLISIDAGTRPDFAKGAYEALQAFAPGLPPLTTVFITHAHWDHVGGHSYFRGLNPHPKFYGRGNYQEEFQREFSAPEVFGKQFFGERFSVADVLSYKPDAMIADRTDLTIGGSKFELIPARGGETHDAMLIYLPEEKVMFMGDVIMPYLGAPFAEE